MALGAIIILLVILSYIGARHIDRRLPEDGYDQIAHGDVIALPPVAYGGQGRTLYYSPVRPNNNWPPANADADLLLNLHDTPTATGAQDDPSAR